MQIITNFRDIGGIQNKEGKKVRPHVFLRSGELSSLSTNSAETLETTYNLRKIIDFRSNEEVKERPDVSVPNTEYVHIDILADIQDEGASMEDFVKIGSPENAEKYMENLYEQIALDKSATKGYYQFFEEILSLQSSESILFHCFAGKDRTGIGAALILETLDVSEKLIYQDYLITNQLRQKENTELIAQAKENHLPTTTLEALNIALNVDSKYLDAFYATVNKQYGSIDEYLNQAIGLSKSMKEEMQNRFLINK